MQCSSPYTIFLTRSTVIAYPHQAIATVEPKQVRHNIELSALVCAASMRVSSRLGSQKKGLFIGSAPMRYIRLSWP
jgi:hypothetical protein